MTPTSSATARIETCSMSPVLISSRSVAARISSRSRSPCPRLARRRREGAGVVGRAASVGSATGSALLDGGEYSALGGDRSGSGLDLQRLLGFLDAEAHQFALPASRMKAGTRVPRMSVASISTASASPTPSSLMNVICDVAKAMNTTDSRPAAAVTMRPVRSSPTATEAVLSPVRSYSSLIRDSRNTS